MGGIVCALALLAASAQEAPLVEAFDTGTAAGAPLAPEAFARRTGWTRLPEDALKHRFKGDLVLANGQVALVLRRQGRGAELHALTPNGGVWRAALVPASSGAPAASFVSAALKEYTADSASVDATFKTAEGVPLALGFELRLGQVFVQAQPRANVGSLQVAAPCRFAVVPDFFADDLVVDAAELAGAEAELPGENILLHLLGDGESLLMAIRHPAGEDIRAALTGPANARRFASSELAFAKDGKAWVAILEGPGIWHRRDLQAEDAGQVLSLDWRPPYTAHWRVDWTRDDRLTDSWEMLTQKPDGEWVKHGWYGQPESFGNVDWLQAGRTRWTTVLGFFPYPCWIDKDGAGFFQPLKKGLRFVGPALIYPINRVEATPLERFTVVDVMRATLGVGPCEYVLDVEGQKKTFEGQPTCASRTILNAIYGKREQRAKRAEVLRTLDEVGAFVRHIRGRIEDYAAFSRQMVAWLEQQKRERPQFAATLEELEALARKTEGYVAHRQEGIKTPAFAAGLVEDFRNQLVDYEGDDALARCKKITAALVDIGGNQDELVGECRTVVKVLRQRAAMALARDGRLEPVAREIRRRTQQMLRNPTSYEAPRH